MGFIYRKSVNIGPFRVNLSKSGVGYSVGDRSFRLGRTIITGEQGNQNRVAPSDNRNQKF